MKVISNAVILGAFLLGKVAAEDNLQLVCDACSGCANLGSFCDVDAVAEEACQPDRCIALDSSGAVCTACEECDANDACVPYDIANDICVEYCDVSLPDPNDEGGLLDAVADAIGIEIPECFSETATVQVFGKGTTQMKDLQIGDSVLTEQGVYESVYAFGHHHPTKMATFLQIHSQAQEEPLEITPGHMVFLKDKATPVPAQDVKVGDVLRGLQGTENTVQKIESVQKEGIYAPLSMGGSLLVNGISASSYVVVSGQQFLLSDHDLVHTALSPYRMLCNGVSSVFCNTQFHHKESGMPYYAKYGMDLLKALLESNVVVKTLGMSTILALTGTFQVVENIFGASLAPLAVFVLAIVYASKKKEVQAKI